MPEMGGTDLITPPLSEKIYNIPDIWEPLGTLS